jgi:hypothetical protein
VIILLLSHSTELVNNQDVSPKSELIYRITLLAARNVSQFLVIARLLMNVKHLIEKDESRNSRYLRKLEAELLSFEKPFAVVTPRL